MRRTLTLRAMSGLIVSLTCLLAWAGPDVSPQGLRFDGFTEPDRQAELAAGEPGILDKVLVKEGDRVERGQVLAKLDSAVLECTLETARQRSQVEGAVQLAQAEMESKRNRLDLLLPLRDRGHSTQSEIDQAKTDLRIAEARLVMAREELLLQASECRRIETQIQRRQITAPFAGVVSEVVREEGEAVMANDARVLTLVQLDRLRARFPVDPQIATELQVGQTVQVEMNDRQTVVEATVEFISPVIEAKSSTVAVMVVMNNEAQSIASGARCSLIVTVTRPEGREAVTKYTSATKKNKN